MRWPAYPRVQLVYFLVIPRVRWNVGDVMAMAMAMVMAVVMVIVYVMVI